MECQHLLATKEQNTVQNGYGREGVKSNPVLGAWATFYGLDGGYFPLYDDVVRAVEAEKAATGATGATGATARCSVLTIHLQLSCDMWSHDVSEHAFATLL
jgi:hypothetical protein